MKAILTAAAIGLAVIGSVGSAPAQPYGGGYDRGPDRGYGDRGPRARDYDERDRGYGDRGRGDRRYGFDEREYLRCNPDVRRAVSRGQMESGAVHYQAYGRREGRRLTC